MNAAQLHLLLNHLPVLGTIFGLLLGAYGLAAKKEDVARAALGVFVLAALAAGAAYLTGENAEDLVESVVGVSEAHLERHEDVAVWALVGAGVLGVFALGVLVVRRGKTVGRTLLAAVLVGALAVSGLMAYTAHIGGQISHPEIRGAVAATGGTAGYEHDD
jgi:uncharacterized membrane protein